MGMYTELVLKFEVSKNMDKEVMVVLKYLFNGGDEPTNKPNHPFFSLPRWDFIGRCSSFYHHPESVNSWYDVDYSDTIYVFSRSDLKDYNNEIEQFINWAKDYITPSTGSCVGWTWHEEEDSPTLLFIEEEK